MADELAAKDQLKDLLSDTLGHASSPIEGLNVFRAGKEDYFRTSDDKKVDSVLGVLLFSQRPMRTWWESKEVTNKPPNCWSLDGLKPHPNSEAPQSDTCSACPHDKFGTAHIGRGKACKTRASDFIFELAMDTTMIRPPTAKAIEVVSVKTEEIIGPALIRYAISNGASVNSWSALQRFAREHKTYPQGLLLRWKFSAQESKNGTAFHAVVIEPVAKLSDETVADLVLPMVKSLKAGGAENVLTALAGSAGSDE